MRLQPERAGGQRPDLGEVVEDGVDAPVDAAEPVPAADVPDDVVGVEVAHGLEVASMKEVDVLPGAHDGAVLTHAAQPGSKQ